MRCAFCHDDSTARDTTACDTCGTRLHQACWRLAGHCTTLGCGGGAEKSRLRRWGDALLVHLYSLGLDWSGVVESSSSEHLVSLAWSRLGAGDLDGAVSAASKAVARDRAPDAYLVRAYLRGIQHEWEEALSDTGELIHLVPELPYGLLLRAEALEHLGDEAGADDALRRLRSSCEEGARRGEGQALELLAWAHVHGWEFAKALELLEPHGPSVVLAHARRALGDLGGALRCLDACLLERPHDVATSCSRAFARCLGADFDGAHDDAVSAVKGEPGAGSGRALLTRALVRALDDDRLGALDDLRAAQRQTPRWLHLALWRLGLGDEGVERPDADELPAWSARLVETAFERSGSDMILIAAQALHGRRKQVTAQQEVHWIQGLLAEQRGRRGDAIAHYQGVVELGDTSWLQYTWSFARLRRWGLKPGHRALVSSPSAASS